MCVYIYVCFYDTKTKWKNTYKMLGIKGEVALENFIIFDIFSSLRLKFDYYPTSIVWLPRLGVLSLCSRKSTETWLEPCGLWKIGKKFVPIMETVKG